MIATLALCSPAWAMEEVARARGFHLPVAPLLILIGALDDWTPVGSNPEARKKAYDTMFEFLDRELR